MPRDGSGTYTLPEAAFVNGNVADADDVNSNFSDIATALTASINTSGTKAFGANQAMGGFKLTGLGAATANGDAVRYEQAYRVGGTDVALADGGTGASTAADARTNLGITATGADTTYAFRANNLSDVASASTARTNLGLGTIATEDIATDAQFWAGTGGKAVDTTTVTNANAVVTLTDASTIAISPTTFINATVTLGGNRTLGQPATTFVGRSGFIRIVQDGTGSRTLAFHSDWKFADGTDPTLSTAAGAVDILYYTCIAANFWHATLVKAVA